MSNLVSNCWLNRNCADFLTALYQVAGTSLAIDLVGAGEASAEVYFLSKQG